MSDALLKFQWLILACWLELYVSSCAKSEPLVLVGHPAVEAKFVSADAEGKLTFRYEETDRVITLDQLVSWSTVKINAKRAELLLVDGSRLVLADSWTGKPTWELKEQVVKATTNSFGKITVPRESVRAILINAPRSLVRRTEFIDRRIMFGDSSARLLLSNGDRWDGSNITCTANKDAKLAVAITAPASQRTLETPVDQLAAIVLNALGKAEQQAGKLWIGTRDGSLLSAESLSVEDSQLRSQLACGINLKADGSDRLAYLRSSQTPIAYLSDRDDAAYRHVPYLNVTWPYTRDRNVLSGPLQASGRTYSKGLGVTTATRLSFQVDSEKYDRFVANAAIDSVAGQRGSAIFRVYLKKDQFQRDGLHNAGHWELAFESSVVRGGEEPVPIAIDLQEATHLALVTDFADRGDELDYANWLDARLE